MWPDLELDSKIWPDIWLTGTEYSVHLYYLLFCLLHEMFCDIVVDSFKNA